MGMSRLRASFSYACTEQTCDFDAGASSDPDGTIVGFDWSFGDGASGEGVTVSHTYGADGAYPVTLMVTDAGGATDTEIQTVQIGAVGATMHVGDLEGSGSVTNKKFWKASVTITIHDAAHGGLADATVSATWSGGASGSGSCLTDGAGQCTIVSGNISRENASATLTIVNVTAAGYAYDAGSNHDLDGDTDGTSINVVLN